MNAEKFLVCLLVFFISSQYLSLGKMQEQKLIIVGIEGASQKILKEMIHQGKLPHLLHLLNTGGFLENISSVYPLVSPTTWTSFSTFSNPGIHGIFGWQQCDLTKNRIYIPLSNNIKAPTFWETLSSHGIKVCIINAYMTFPPEKINGTIISGSPSPEVSVYPPSLLNLLHKMKYKVEARGYVNTPADEFFEDLKDVIHKRTDLALYLMKNRKLDMCFILYNAIDRCQHPYWKDVIENRKHKKDVYQIYEEIDKSIGRLMDSYPESTVLIVNDHEFRRVKIRFHLGFWLFKEGYSKPVSTFQSKLNLFLLFLDTLIKKFKINKLLHLFLLNSKSFSSSTLYFPKVRIDFNKSIAFTCSFYEPGIYLNPNLSPKEKEEIEKELIEKLMKVKDPITGRKVIKRVYKKEELYHGPYVNYAPDLIVIPNENYSVVGLISYYGLFERNLRETGTHKFGGFIISNSPFFRNISSIEDVGKKILLFFNVSANLNEEKYKWE